MPLFNRKLKQKLSFTSPHSLQHCVAALQRLKADKFPKDYLVVHINEVDHETSRFSISFSRTGSMQGGGMNAILIGQMKRSKRGTHIEGEWKLPMSERAFHVVTIGGMSIMTLLAALNADWGISILLAGFTLAMFCFLSLTSGIGASELELALKEMLTVKPKHKKR